MVAPLEDATLEDMAYTIVEDENWNGASGGS